MFRIKDIMMVLNKKMRKKQIKEYIKNIIKIKHYNGLVGTG